MIDPFTAIADPTRRRIIALLAEQDRTVNEIMNPNIVSIPVDADQEEAARLMAKYDLLALPVVRSKMSEAQNHRLSPPLRRGVLPCRGIDRHNIPHCGIDVKPFLP